MGGKITSGIPRKKPRVFAHIFRLSLAGNARYQCKKCHKRTGFLPANKRGISCAVCNAAVSD